MKKIITFITLVMISVMAYAQTVEHSKLFENTSVTVFGGGITTGQFNQVPSPFFWDGAKGVVKGVRPYMGVELGKYVTPVVGFSLEGIGFVGTTSSYTFFDESAVLVNGKLNFSNWFGGYKGQPRRIEVVGVLGMGWGHDYVGNGQTWTRYANSDLETVMGTNTYVPAEENKVATDRDYVAYKAGAEFNINLGEKRAWQINVRPGVMWFNKHTKTQYQSLPRFMSDGRADVEVGVTYKFGSKSKKSHNFVLCPYSVTQADYDAALAALEAEKNKPAVVQEVVKTVTDTVEVVVKDTRVLVGSNIITFAIGSCALTEVERAKIDAFAKSLDEDTLIQIVGSADSKTGTETRNFALANNRANVVKNVLINDYNIAPERIHVATTLDATDNALTSRSAILTLSVE